MNCARKVRRSSKQISELCDFRIYLILIIHGFSGMYCLIAIFNDNVDAIHRFLLRLNLAIVRLSFLERIEVLSFTFELC